MAAHDKLNEGCQLNYRKTRTLVKRLQVHLTQIVRAPKLIASTGAIRSNRIKSGSPRP